MKMEYFSLIILATSEKGLETTVPLIPHPLNRNVNITRIIILKLITHLLRSYHKASNDPSLILIKASHFVHVYRIYRDMSKAVNSASHLGQLHDIAGFEFAA